MPSSVIRKYHYDAAQEILTIVYVSGAIYDYLEVPAEVYEDFRKAYSKGVFLNRNIKPYFRFQKI